jgi:hypothetical protein
LRCRFRKHQPTTISAAIDGTPMATPSPMATGLFIPDAPPPWESASVGC